MSRPLYVLSAIDIQDVISDLGVDAIVDIVFDGLHVAAVKDTVKVEIPHRTSIDSTRRTTLFMPSRLRETTVIKIVSVPKSSASEGGGLPATTLVLDEKSGVVDAVVNARSLTALRTAAGSVIATKLVLGSKITTARAVALFGAGAQVQAHAELLIASFSSIVECAVINRSSNTRLVTLVDYLRGRFPHINVIGLAAKDEKVEQTVKRADIIVTATSSTESLFPTTWVKSGAHVNLIGSFTPSMREVEDSLIRRSRVLLVDSRSACAREAGELISAGIDFDECVELGECDWNWNGGGVRAAGTDRSNDDITVYKSVGVSVMDAAITNLVVTAARQRGRGVHVPFD